MNAPTSQPAEHANLQFHLARGLPYAVRFLWVAGLLAAGILLELLLAGPGTFAGVACFLAAGLLLTAAGYTNRPRVVSGGFWKTTDLDRLRQIVDLNQRSQRWDYAAIDVSNPVGFFTLLVVAAGITAAGWFGERLRPGTGFLLVVLSGAALLLPIWFSGWRAGHTRAGLIQTIRVLQGILEAYHRQARPSETLQASLLLEGTDANAVPTNARLQFTWPQASAEFHGLQCQVNINEVQGRKYPYCYFVAVAQRGLGILPLARQLAAPARITVEPQIQADVEVIVIRGQTTRTSGYHTKPAQYRELLDFALRIARRIADERPRAGPPAPGV